MSFGATANILQEFNTYEAIFWLVLGTGFYLYRLRASHPYRHWLLFSATNIFIFGGTDIIEIYTGGFLHTAHWLLYWKIVHVIGLIVSIGWYFRLRLESKI